jgi:hypothetical protein
VARTPHLAVPFRIIGGKTAVVEQDSVDEVRDCVFALLSTRLGSRIELPEYGIPDELFGLVAPGEIDISALLAVIEEWEPRAGATGSASLEDLVKTVEIRLNRSE